MNTALIAVPHPVRIDVPEILWLHSSGENTKKPGVLPGLILI
jgi:hypothetical protein